METLFSLVVGPPIVSPYLYDNYEAQQLDELVTLLNSTSSLRDNTIFMGDFNHGPVLATPPGVSATVPEFPLLYGLVNAYGYYSPYVLRDGRCTFCAENPDVTIPSRVIDHIYVAVTASDRVVYSEVGTWGGGGILEPLNVVYVAVTASDRVMYSEVGSWGGQNIGTP